MRERQTGGGRSVERGLSLAFQLAVAASLLGAIAAFVGGTWVQGIVSLFLLGLIVVLWRQRRREASGAGVAVALAGAVMALSILPALGPASLLLILVTLILVAFDLGIVIGAAVAVTYGPVFAVSALLIYDAPIADVLTENGALVVLLVMTAGFGALMRSSEGARREATALGVDLTRANEALRRSLSLERDLVLATERARSARELHDGLGYRLTLVAMSLEYAQSARNLDREAAWDEVGIAADTTRAALAEMRRWVRALNPPLADAELGGSAAFDAIADAFRGTGLDVRVTHRGETQALGRDAALFATRFMQEGLTNVLRHAGASRVDIAIIQSPQQMRLSIGDDGSGLCDADEGFGRRSLRERADLLGGVVSTGRSTLGGLDLIAVVPTATVS